MNLVFAFKSEASLEKHTRAAGVDENWCITTVHVEAKDEHIVRYGGKRDLLGGVDTWLVRSRKEARV